MASDDDPDDPVKPPLDGSIGFRATDTATPGSSPTALVRAPPASPPVRRPPPARPWSRPAADLLLWLYGRTELDTTRVPSDVLERFRAMTFTD